VRWRGELGLEGQQTRFLFQIVIPSNARDLGICWRLAVAQARARTNVPRVARDDNPFFTMTSCYAG